MQRVQDIIQHDLDWIFEVARDFTMPITIQSGSEKAVVKASIQADKMDFSAGESPINAYSFTAYIREAELPESITKSITKDAIIYINQAAYRVIDTAVDLGVMRRISVEKHVSRGRITPRPI
jgi:hypothetical protein